MNNQMKDILFHLSKLQNFGDKFYSFIDVAKMIDSNLSFGMIKDYSVFLYNRRYIEIYLECGIPFVKISVLGKDFINILNYISTSSIDYSIIQVYEDSLYLELRRPLFEILESMKNEIRKKRQSKTDTNKTLTMISIELNKEHPNSELLKIMIQSLKLNSKIFTQNLIRLEIILFTNY